jgi:Neuraminidase (sialidase)
MGIKLRKLILIITGIAGLAGCAWASNADKVSIRQHTVFNGNAGVEINGTVYRLACAALVTDCSNGDLVCTWLSGSAKEPSTDNCMLISRSQDGGKTWSRPEIFVPAGEMALS